MAESRILAIDAGTTGITVTAYDRSFRPELSRSADFAQHYPQAGWVEHDAAEIRDLTLRLAREVAALVGGEIRAVGITNQRETIVPFDAESGEPLHRAIVWQCRRTSEACGKLRSEGHEPLITARTGLVLDPYFSASKIAWLLEHSPACRAAQSRGTLRVATIDAWLVHALTQGRTLATDPSNASRTLLYDIDQRTWASELLALFGIPAFVLPEVRPSAGDFGTTDATRVGFKAPITGVLGDQQAALFGHGGFSVGDAKNTYGTGCFLLMNAGSTRPAACPGVLTTLGAAPDGTPIYVQEGAVFVAGAAVQWLRDGLRIIRSAEETEALAASLPDNGGVYLVPAFTGLGAPYWDPDARGLICGLTRGSTSAHLVRATLESIAYQVSDLVQLMNRSGSHPIANLRVDGGAAANDWLMQFQADLLRVSVLRGADLEVTSRGAALIAAVGADPKFDPRTPEHRSQASRRFESQGSSAHTNALLEGWSRAVARARSGGCGRESPPVS